MQVKIRMSMRLILERGRTLHTDVQQRRPVDKDGNIRSLMTLKTNILVY